MWPLVFGWLATRHRDRPGAPAHRADIGGGRGGARDRRRVGQRRRVLGDAGASRRDPARRVARGSTRRAVTARFVGASRTVGVARAGAGRDRASGRRRPHVSRWAAARRCRERFADRRTPGARTAAKSPRTPPARRRGPHQLRRLSLSLADLRDPRRGPYRPDRSGVARAAAGGDGSHRDAVVRTGRTPDPARRMAAAPDLGRFAGRHDCGGIGGSRHPGDDRRRLLARAPDDIAALVARASTIAPSPPASSISTVETVLTAPPTTTATAATVETTASSPSRNHRRRRSRPRRK